MNECKGNQQQQQHICHPHHRDHPHRHCQLQPLFYALTFEYLVSSFWNHLGRIMRFGFVGRDVSPGVDFELSKY